MNIQSDTTQLCLRDWVGLNQTFLFKTFGLSTTDRNVLCVLLIRKGQNDSCSPSIDTIAEDACASVRAVKKALAALTARCLMETKRGKQNSAIRTFKGLEVFYEAFVWGSRERCNL